MRVLKLQHPLKIGTTEVTELKFRDRMKAKDFKAFSKVGAEQAIELVASLTGTSEEMIEELADVDYLIATDIAYKIFESAETESAKIKSEKYPELLSPEQQAMVKKSSE